MLLRFQVLRVEAMHLRARALLAKSPTSNDLDELRIAERLARKIEKEKISWVKPFAMLIHATVAQRRNQSKQAVTLLSQAIQGFENSGMNLYAAATRRRLGETLADDKGCELITQADAWMTAQRIKAPESITRLLVPGF
jgi:hypothetical protein